MYIWDYQVGKNWKPKTRDEWEWFLVRKINYGDLKGITKSILKKYFVRIQKKLDPGKKMLLEYYLKKS